MNNCKKLVCKDCKLYRKLFNTIIKFPGKDRYMCKDCLFEVCCYRCDKNKRVRKYDNGDLLCDDCIRMIKIKQHKLKNSTRDPSAQVGWKDLDKMINLKAENHIIIPDGKIILTNSPKNNVDSESDRSYNSKTDSD